jgi:WD40 repeat protein
VWDAASGEELAVLTGHTDSVRHAAWSPDGTRIVTASGDETARVWDAASGEELAVLAGHTGSVRHAAWSPDGTRIVTASGDETARVWDATSGEELAVLTGHTDWVGHAAWSPDGTRVVTLSSTSDRTARVWDAETGAELLTLGYRDSIHQVEWNADGTRIFGSGQMAQVWDATSGEELALLFDSYGPVVTTSRSIRLHIRAHVVWSPDGTRIVTAVCDASDNHGCLASTARVWDATSGEELAVLTGHTDDVQHVAWSPDGMRIVTASADGTARVWDAASGEELVVLAAGSHR